MVKISAVAYLRMWLISEYIWYNLWPRCQNQHRTSKLKQWISRFNWL